MIHTKTYGEQKAWFAAQLEFINKMIRQLEDQRKVVEQRKRDLEAHRWPR